MVLERIIEASYYITVSYFGELYWNEIRSKRSNMISLWNMCTWIPYVPVWDQTGRGAAQVVQVVTQRAPISASSDLWPRVSSTSYACLRSSNSEHHFSYGGRYGILTGFSRRCGECGLSLSSKANIGITTFNVLFTIRTRWRPEDGEKRRTKVIYRCS